MRNRYPSPSIFNFCPALYAMGLIPSGHAAFHASSRLVPAAVHVAGTAGGAASASEWHMVRRTGLCLPLLSHTLRRKVTRFSFHSVN